MFFLLMIIEGILYIWFIHLDRKKRWPVAKDPPVAKDEQTSIENGSKSMCLENNQRLKGKT